MKLLFVENRHKTYFFEPIANQLSKNGHEIHWIVQNKQFLPSGDFNNYIINYPSDKINTFKRDEDVEEVIKSDRQLNHFNKQDTSYFYYYNQKIGEYLKKLQPDFVFGESTAFHELLTINNCKKLNILYLNPSTCRYPIGRFSFYKYDTLEPFKGSNELLSNEDAEEVIDQIIERKTAPDYMKPSPVSKGRIIKDKIKKTYAYVKGEKYNTPHPLIKYQLEKKRKNNIEAWNTNADKEILKDSSFKILYPLQMQPEANIDVWGRKHRNQKKLIKSILEQLPENTVLYVKPNPKSKYELNGELLEFINAKNNAIHLHHSTKMDDVLQNINLVITVTGTIAIECVLSNKPVITLVETMNNKANNCLYIESIDGQLNEVINTIKENRFNKLDHKGKIGFINKLNSTSYKGIITDPFSDGNCISSENINNLISAFNSILKTKEF